MSQVPTPPTEPAAAPRRRRRAATAVGITAAGAVVALVAVGWPQAAGERASDAVSGDRAQAVAGESLLEGGAAEPPPAEPVPGDGAEEMLPPVPVGEDVALQADLTATVDGVEDVTITPRGPGDVAGPGEAVRLTLNNGTDEPVDLATLAVTATAPGDVPAIPSDDPSAEPLTGTLAPGEERAATYVFRVPEPGAALSIEVGVNTSSDVAVISAP